MATPWTLEKELCGLTGAPSLHEALCSLGIVETPVPEPVIEEVHDWKRGGGETYIYRFRVIQDDAEQDVLLKAIVAFSISSSLTQLADERVERRRLLQDEGIATPHLYGAERALVVEQFIPQRLSGFLRRGPAQTTHLFDQVFRYAATLEKHGFCPVSPFHGLRTDGTNVFAVDFGQDLGPPGLTSRRGGRLLREAISWLAAASKQSIDKRRAKAVFAFHADDSKSGAIT